MAAETGVIEVPLRVEREELNAALALAQELVDTLERDAGGAG